MPPHRVLVSVRGEKGFDRESAAYDNIILMQAVWDAALCFAHIRRVCGGNQIVISPYPYHITTLFL
jgi:hypothetical protein